MAKTDNSSLRASFSDDDWWLGWSLGTGIPAWVPHNIQEFIVLTWNSMMCKIYGHRVVGVIDGTLCSHCMHCCKETLGTGCRWCELDNRGGEL